jgi:hypothetical protein
MHHTFVYTIGKYYPVFTVKLNLMIITIIPNQLLNAANVITSLYDLAKRHEEDFTRSNPVLKEIVFELVPAILGHDKAQVVFSDDETVVKYLINFLPESTPERTAACISREIDSLRQLLAS